MVVIDDPDRRELLLKLYETHVAEYRFQVQLNNSRFQWWVTLDTALITVGVGLLRVGNGGDGRPLAALVFAVGVLLAGFTAVASTRQTGYYQAARAQANKVAAELGITEFAIATTQGFRQEKKTWVDKLTKVRTMNYFLLSVLAAVNLVGLVYVLATGND